MININIMKYVNKYIIIIDNYKFTHLYLDCYTMNTMLKQLF